jgi:hypothetical protein
MHLLFIAVELIAIGLVSLGSSLKIQISLQDVRVFTPIISQIHGLNFMRTVPWIPSSVTSTPQRDENITKTLIFESLLLTAGKR